MIPYIIFLLLLLAISLPPAFILFTPIRIRISAEKKRSDVRGEISWSAPLKVDK